MNTGPFEPQINLSFEVISDPQPQAVTILVQPGNEKLAPDQPGTSAGSLALTKDHADNLTLTISSGLPGKATAETFRQAGGSLAHWLMEHKVNTALLNTTAFDDQGVHNALDSLCEGALLGAYQFIKYKKPEEQNQCTLFLQAKKNVVALKFRLEKIQKIAYATNLARQIIHEPANVINPQTLSELVEAFSKQYELKCTIFDSARLEEMKAGALLAVGKGSKTPSRLIVIEYPGQNPSAETAPVILVGKAITFDTGGYSIKGSDNIIGMKYDKAGGVAVLATLIAAASLKITQSVVGIIPAAENMISGESYRPDDILISMSGKSIEIVSTDAEGRLILADALTYAQKAFKPKALIDIATLTGGVITALGHIRAGLLSNNDKLANALTNSGEATFERLWRMPLDEEYNELIKSSEADMKNSGGHEASTIMGATFLKQFIEEGTIWAHIDIAGTGDITKDMPYCAKGPTGFGVRLFLDYLQSI